MRLSLAEDPLAAGRATWPGLELPAPVFAAWLAARAPVAHVPDLYLACACAHGDPAALASFERACWSGADAGLARLGATASERDEVHRELAQQLFGGAAPAIADYRGQGELGRWVRAAAVRTWLDLRRRQGGERPASDESLAERSAAPGADAELALLERRCRRELAGGFAAALATLPERDRALLRYHAVDGLTIDDLGAIYKVHRATAFRWLAAARERLSARTHAQLEQRLGLSGAALAPVVRLVRSQLDGSVRRLLG